jgi:hypothetical protein
VRVDDIIPIDTGARNVRVSVQDIRDDERHQTQRRMIAALYWRAGAALAWIRPDDSHDQRRYWRREASVLAGAASAMEAACPR